MVYNYKYKMEWVGLKYANYKLQHPSADVIYYRLEFYKHEEVLNTDLPIKLDGSNNPFTIDYKSKSDFVFETFRPSSAEINIKLGSNSSVVPQDFYSINNNTFKVVFKLINETDVTETTLWTGFLLSSDIQYEWQDEYYIRLTATDNIGILKEFVYSDTTQFSLPLSQDFYDGLSIKDFIVRCLSFIGLDIDVKFAMNFKENMVAINETGMFINEYAAIDWSKKYPRKIDFLLNGLLTTLGCILYQDNRDSSWTILNINELATSTNNLVPYRKYDYLGTSISSGNYDIKKVIARNTDTIWSDVNQIVTLRPPIASVMMELDYSPKNMLPNYGFFQQTSGIADIWEIVNPPVANPYTVIGVLRNPYDDKVMKSIVNESKSGAFTGNSYLAMEVDLQKFTAFYNHNTAAYVNFRESFAINITFDYNIVGGVNGDGFNFTNAFYRPDDAKYLAFDKNGDWNTTTISGLNSSSPVRIDAYADKSEWKKFQVLSKYTSSDGTGSPSSTNWFYSIRDLLFWIRPLRVQTPLSGTPYLLIDNIQLNIVPTNNLTLDNFSYLAFFTNGTYINQNTKKINSYFHSGTGTTASVVSGTNDSFVYEDVIFVKDTIFGSPFIRTAARWERVWETIVTEETNGNHLNALTCASILSFYRSSARRFTGNIYAEQTPITEVIATPVGFPIYTKIEGTTNPVINLNIEDAFEERVLDAGGIVESSYCGSNFLAEFNVQDSYFFSNTASFDYANNRTKMVLEEDLTNEIELMEIGLGPAKYSNSSNFGGTGSTTGNTQTTVVDG